MFTRVRLASILAALALPALTPVAAHAAPTVLIKSVRSIDVAAKTVTFPLHRGTSHGKTVWYILTDVSDIGEAQAKGLTFAPALAGVGATQTVANHGGVWDFPAAPDFSKDRVFTPGATGFPPAAAAPGATADAAYSPFVRVGNGTVYNAPIVATGDGPFDVLKHTNTSDRTLAIDTSAKTVTLLLANGFANGKSVLYISTEASDPGAAAIERAALTPKLASAPESARLKIFVIVNGEEQGLAYAALEGNLSADATAANSATLKTSSNVLGGLPAIGPGGNGIYDPLWDVYVGAWTPEAVAAHKNVTLRSAEAVQAAVAAKLITGPGGKPFGPVGFDVNCPVVAIEN
jgi:hypothetical protein